MMTWIEKLSDDDFRTGLGLRFEALTSEAFNVLRWCVLVGFARYLALSSPSAWLDVINWVTSTLLFGYLASRFLLRPEIPLFLHTDSRWKRIAQTLANYALCMLAFMLVSWALDQLANGVAQYRFGAGCS